MNDLVRHKETNRIISYGDKRFIENTGMLEIPVIDERYLDSDFNYIVKTGFSSLPEAVSAEQNVVKMLKDYENIIYNGIPISGITSSDIDTIKNTAKNELVKNLNNLILGNENSTAALKQKIDELEASVRSKSEQIADWQEAGVEWEHKINAWTQENIFANIRADALERTNIELSRQQEETLDSIKLDVQRQEEFLQNSISTLAENTGKVLDTLAKEVSEIRRFPATLPDLNGVIIQKAKGTSGTSGG
jgi:hypothetical protein